MKRKNINILFILCVILFSSHLKGYSQVIVRDRYTTRQIERSVITRWNRFSPSWYFTLFHNRYKKSSDKRLIHQLSPIIEKTQARQHSSETERKESEEMMQTAALEEAVNAAELSYHLHFKKRWDDYHATFEGLDNQARALDLTERATFLFQKDLLEERLQILQDGHLSSGDFNTGLLLVEDGYKILISRYRKYIQLHQIKNRIIK